MPWQNRKASRQKTPRVSVFGQAPSRRRSYTCAAPLFSIQLDPQDMTGIFISVEVPTPRDGWALLLRKQRKE
ncbi:Hypothetical protein NTJ_03364 [Nesidiocoris tenuis]|uniref:Uncharacterized protein n=1 Tax=Nesidiocoris tenuis TaxID=355587 RepID=A0ABN7AI45_9HEMI|nr:Hypothetical protein NTJ_03364 [Nesidiocoris tenuis]